MPDYSSFILLRKANAVVGREINSLDAVSMDGALKKRLKHLGRQPFSYYASGGGSGGGNGGLILPGVVGLSSITTTTPKLIIATWTNSLTSPIPTGYQIYGYRLFVSQTNILPASPLATYGTTTFQVNITSANNVDPLLDDTIYYFWVQIVFTDTLTQTLIFYGPTQTNNARTIFGTPAPEAFASFNSTSTTIDVSWRVPPSSSAGSVNDYELYISNTDDFAQAVAQTPTPDLSYTFGGLSIATIYYIWIVANYSSSVPSFPLKLVPDANTQIARLVNTISGLQALTISQTTIDLIWAPYTQLISGDAFLQYSIYHSTISTKPSTPTFTAVGQSTSFFQVSGLNPNTLYYIWVEAIFTNAGPSWPAALVRRTAL